MDFEKRRRILIEIRTSRFRVMNHYALRIIDIIICIYEHNIKCIMY